MVGIGGVRIDEIGVSSFLDRVWQKRVDIGSVRHCIHVPVKLVLYSKERGV